jgi:hypothetical protein
MKRAILSSILLFCTVSASAPAPDFPARLIAFHQLYDPFFRDYFGCAAHETDPSRCDPKTGHMDYAEYSKARKAAMKLFDLVAPPI